MKVEKKILMLFYRRQVHTRLVIENHKDRFSLIHSFVFDRCRCVHNIVNNDERRVRISAIATCPTSATATTPTPPLTIPTLL